MTWHDVWFSLKVGPVNKKYNIRFFLQTIFLFFFFLQILLLLIFSLELRTNSSHFEYWLIYHFTSNSDLFKDRLWEAVNKEWMHCLRKEPVENLLIPSSVVQVVISIFLISLPLSFISFLVNFICISTITTHSVYFMCISINYLVSY